MVPDKAIVFTKNYSVMVDFSVLVTGGAGYIGSHAALIAADMLKTRAE